MPAYVLLIRDEPVRDEAEMAIYQTKNGEAPRDPRMTPLVRYGAMTPLEGPLPDGVVILQFPSVEDARAWYDSPAYRAALPHRLAAADYRVMIVEGL